MNSVVRTLSTWPHKPSSVSGNRSFAKPGSMPVVKQAVPHHGEAQQPYSALELQGRDLYVREGCYTCHSQMVRPFRAETERYGHYSVAGEFVYDHPFQWGSKRTGPDLWRVGGRYSDEWHRIHLINPRDVVPESNMPAYPWLAKAAIEPESVAPRMKALRTLGVPYTDDDIKGAAEEIIQRETDDKC